MVYGQIFVQTIKGFHTLLNCTTIGKICANWFEIYGPLIKKMEHMLDIMILNCIQDDHFKCKLKHDSRCMNKF